MEKLNLIRLKLCYQTTYHKVGVMLQHSFAEFWERFEDFLAIFYFSPKIFLENFGQQVPVVNQPKS